MTIHLNKLTIPSSKNAFSLSLVEISQLSMENKMQMWKVYENNDNKQRTNFD